MKNYERIHRFYENMERYGFTLGEADALRRIEMTLSRWSERECNGEIERDETTNKPYLHIQMFSGSDKRYPTADKETGALKRMEKIRDERNKRENNTVLIYHQGDPRGCSLYVIRQSDIKDGERIDAVYTRGVAICY